MTHKHLRIVIGNTFLQLLVGCYRDLVKQPHPLRRDPTINKIIPSKHRNNMQRQRKKCDTHACTEAAIQPPVPSRRPVRIWSFTPHPTRFLYCDLAQVVNCFRWPWSARNSPALPPAFPSRRSTTPHRVPQGS